MDNKMFETKKQEHPGWALQTKKGSWLCYAHGWHLVEDAFYAKIFSSIEDASEALIDLKDDFDSSLEADIVPAWEPLCGKLRFEVAELKTANTITPDVLSDIAFDLDIILFKLKGR